VFAYVGSIQNLKDLKEQGHPPTHMEVRHGDPSHGRAGLAHHREPYALEGWILEI